MCLIYISFLTFGLFLLLPNTAGKTPMGEDCVWLWWTKSLTNMCFESLFKGTFQVMELGMEVGGALWVGSHAALWKVVTRGQPTGWHPWSASHCLCFRSSKPASFLSLFGERLLKRGLGYFPWNNTSWGRICTHLWMKLLNSVSTRLQKVHVNWRVMCAAPGLCVGATQHPQFGF